MDVPYMEESEIRSAARELVCEAFGPQPTHPLDLEALLYDHLYEEYGLGFFNDRPLGREDEQDVLGATYPLENEIHVDRRLAREGHRGRYRFTVAHELGHWRLHRPLFLEGRSDGRRESGDTRIVTFERDVVESEETYRPEEWQANCFAIWLLLGDRALEEQFARRFGEPPFACAAVSSGDGRDVRDVSRALAATPKEGLKPLHERFALSVEATAIALEEREYVREAVSV